MFKKIKKSLIVSSTALTMLVSLMVPALSVSAASCSSTANDLTNGINQATGGNASCTSGTNVQSGIKSVAKTATGIFALVVGIISVFAIIYAGAKYITSGGNNDKTNQAKNTLLYAIIGLVVASLAGTISVWVLRTTSSIQ